MSSPALDIFSDMLGNPRELANDCEGLLNDKVLFRYQNRDRSINRRRHVFYNSQNFWVGIGTDEIHRRDVDE